MAKTTFNEEQEAAIFAAIAKKEGPVKPMQQLADDELEWSINTVELYVNDIEIRLQLLTNWAERVLPAKKRSSIIEYNWCAVTK